MPLVAVTLKPSRGQTDMPFTTETENENYCPGTVEGERWLGGVA